MLYLHVNTKSAKRVALNKRSGGVGEYYWTWRVVSGNNDETSIAQGFSVKPPIDDGIDLRKGEEFTELNDPKFTIELPDVKEGEFRKAKVELFCWEHDSDRNTLEIKKAFSNSGLQKLIEITQKYHDRKEKVFTSFKDWLKSDDLSVITTALGISSFSLLPVINSAVNLIPSLVFLIDGDDDYLGSRSVDIIYTKNADTHQYEYQYIGDDGCTSPLTPFTQSIKNNVVKFVRSDRKDEVDIDVIYQMLTH